MTIPHDDDIQDALIAFLFSKPAHRAHAQQCYAGLEKQFPGLTDDEVNVPYRSSVSKWANRVQFARLHLVVDGYIFPARTGLSPSTGVWILTPLGETRGRQLSR